MYDVGSRLKYIRSKRGLTQKDLAKRINKSVSAICTYETRAQTTPTDVLISIAEVLRVPLTYFVDLSCQESYSAKGLSADQKELLNLLFAEFTNPSSQNRDLSNRQIDIIRRLFSIFSK